MTHEEDSSAVLSAIRTELADWHLWAGRALVLAFAALAGLTVVLFTWLTERAFAAFELVQSGRWWLPLIWTPLCTAAIIWLMRRYAVGSAGSGIPQVMAALDASVTPSHRSLYVSLKLTLAKMALSSWGLLAGLSLGREGPSVQIAAGVMHHARRYLPDKSQVSAHGLMMAGGAAGIAAAFNTPLGGVMFAIEELSRKPEQRSSGLLLAAIVLSGLMAVSIYGNATYFGVIRIENLSTALLLPGLAVAVLSGLAGGLFARLLLISIRGDGVDRFSRWRRQSPVKFAAGCGLVTALICLASNGTPFGTGYPHTRAMLEGNNDT